MSIFAKIENGDYLTKLPYPPKVVENPLVFKSVKNMTDDEVDRLAAVVAEYRQSIADRDAAKVARRVDATRLQEQFKKDIEAEYNMVGHPKADLLFEKAWDMGHSSGYNEVAQYYNDLHELVA